MKQVTIEMYRMIDPDDGVNKIFALNAEKNEVAPATYRHKSKWLTPKGFGNPALWSFISCDYYGGIKAIRNSQHIWTYTFTVED